MSGIAYATIEDARMVVGQWGGKEESLEHLGDSGSTVFQFINTSELPQILRLTDQNFRSRDHVEAELQFIQHLHQSGCTVGVGLSTHYGASTIVHQSERGRFIVASFSFAPGKIIRPETKAWNPAFFKAWGTALGQIHKASQNYQPPENAPRLWHWQNEILFEQAYQLIPSTDLVLRKILEATLAECLAKPTDPYTYGIIHADFGPQNFHYDTLTGNITAFDFGNSCYHYYIADLAIALSTLAKVEKREEAKNFLLGAYSVAFGLPPDYEYELDKLMRLRMIYVYLDRLFVQAQRPVSQETQQILDQIRVKIIRKEGAWW